MRALWSDRKTCSHNVSQKVKRIRRLSELQCWRGPCVVFLFWAYLGRCNCIKFQLPALKHETSDASRLSVLFTSTDSTEREDCNCNRIIRGLQGRTTPITPLHELIPPAIIDIYIYIDAVKLPVEILSPNKKKVCNLIMMSPTVGSTVFTIPVPNLKQMRALSRPRHLDQLAHNHSCFQP